MTVTHADQLDQLEGPVDRILRVTAAEFEKAVLMYSCGKDSRHIDARD